MTLVPARLAVVSSLSVARTSSESYQSRAPLKPERRSASIVIVIVVIVGGPKSTRLRVDCHFAGLPIQGSGGFDIFAVARDDDVRPSVGLQFLPYLLGGDRPAGLPP